MNEIEIQILERQSVQTRLESRFDALGPVIGVPQLCGYKYVFARDPSIGKSCLQRTAYLALVLVSFRTIEVSKSSFQCVSGRSYRRGRVGNQGAKAECGHMASTVVQWDFCHPQIGRFNHWLHLQAILRAASPPKFKNQMPGAADWPPIPG
jgi:hypothetical protein